MISFRNDISLCWMQSDKSVGNDLHWRHWSDNLPLIVRIDASVEILSSIIRTHCEAFIFRLKIDDPLDAFAVHAGGGFWGLISVCIFAENGGVIYAIFGSYPITEALLQLGWNVISGLAIMVWSATVMIPIFLILKVAGKFRVPAEVEIKGIDIIKHGESAYPLTAYGHGWDDELDDTAKVLHHMKMAHTGNFSTPRSPDSVDTLGDGQNSYFTNDGWAVIHHRSGETSKMNNPYKN